jgi:Plasmid encoded RepA protein
MLRKLTPIEFRRLEASLEIHENPAERIAFQHTIFCQTYLPYKNPGPVRIWERKQGAVFLRMEAGAIKEPGKNRFIDVGLPYGSRPRLIMAHLNREALIKGSPKIEVEATLTGFIKRISNKKPNSREIARFKDQLARFAASAVRMAVDLPEMRSYQIQTHIIDAMELWLTKDENQRVLWPAVVELSPRYFESLQKHAVPLDERAIGALSNSPMALDVYAWLAQRLCRIQQGKSQFVSWVNLYDQFGQEFTRLRKFRESFQTALSAAYGQYRWANFEVNEGGLRLFASRPPIVLREVRGL